MSVEVPAERRRAESGAGAHGHRRNVLQVRCTTRNAETVGQVPTTDLPAGLGPLISWALGRWDLVECARLEPIDMVAADEG